MAITAISYFQHFASHSSKQAKEKLGTDRNESRKLFDQSTKEFRLVVACRFSPTTVLGVRILNNLAAATSRDSQTDFPVICIVAFSQLHYDVASLLHVGIN